MKNVLNECIEKIQKNRRNYRRYLAVFLVLALVTTLGVNWGLHRNGVSMTADYYCGLEEHQHTEDCYTKVLVCGLEEGQVVEAGTDAAAADGQSGAGSAADQAAADAQDGADSSADAQNGAGSTGHVHTDACYEEQLTCGKQEHTHSTACLIDTTADVETSADWEATIPTALSGDWQTDLVSVAKSQVGYKESTQNFTLAADGTTRMGYTRYGAWYGDAYGSWDAMLVSFCLSYAGIPSGSIPAGSNSSAWMNTLDELGLFVEASDWEPASGNIIFFDLKNSDGIADHVGIITSVDQDDDGTAKTIYTIEGDSSDKVEEKQYSAKSETILGYVIVSEETVNAANAAKVMTADLDDATDDTSNDNSNDALDGGDGSGAAPQSNSVGVDMGDYIGTVSFQKKDGVIWKESDSFTTADQVRATINFDDVYTSTLKANSNTIYVDLPKGIDCSKFTGTYETYDGGTKSGTYTYQQNEDGTWRIVLTLLDDYVNNAGDTIGGSLEFNFQWTTEAIPDEGGKTTVDIGKWSGEIEIKKDTEEGGASGSNYWINKNAGSLYMNDDGKTAYIDYTITLVVKNDTKGPITLSDALEGSGFTYDDTVNVSDNNVKVNFSNKQSFGTSTDIQIWSNSSSTDIIPAGTYTITYRVKSTADNISEGTVIPDQVKNAVTVPDGDNTLTAQTWTKVTSGTINKQGKLVSGSDATYIDYTVYLNAEGVIKNLKTPAVFTDTIPDYLELIGNVTVEQYDVTGKKINTTTATVADGNISYTTPTGQYYYIITYRTKVKGSELPIGDTVISNTGTSTGGIEGSSTSEVTIPNDVLSKSFVSQDLGQNSEGKWIDTIKWTSTVDVTGSLKGYVYEDWSNLWGSESGTHFAPMYMSEAQRSAIVIKDANGNTVDADKYTVTDSDHTERGWTGSENVDMKTGLFKITFSDAVTGPVTIEYATTVDMSNFKVGSPLTFVNHASLTKDGHVDYADAQTTQLLYQHDQKEVIYKYGESWPQDNGNSGTITLKPGDTSIPWSIVVNHGKNMTSDLVITDTIAEDLTFLPDTFKVMMNESSADITNRDGVTWKYDETTRKLTVAIKADVYKAEYQDFASWNITISYRTKLPDDFFSGGTTEKKFENTATVEKDGTTTDSTYTQDVIRQVVGKSGSYDKTNQVLSYNVVINPDASTLNKGETLTVIDQLDAGSISDYVSLKSLQLFTALKTTDAKGNVTVEPGKLLRELTLADSGSAEFTYTWDDTSKSFTTYLPDGTAYVIVAKYDVGTDVTQDIQMKNTVKIEGNDSWKKEDSSTKVEQDTSGQTWTGMRLTVTKRDTAQYGKVLEGASFELDQYSDGSWSKVSDLKTGTDGTAIQEKIELKTLYKLGEIEAPEGYVVEAGPIYFIVVKESDASTAKDNLPDAISSDATYSKDAVVVYTIGDKETTANIQLDRYDNQDTSKVYPGQLRVNKVWIDSDGNTVTDAGSMPEVEVTLTKHVPEASPVVTIKAQDSQWSDTRTQTINTGGYLVFNITSSQYTQLSWSCTDSGATLEAAQNADGSYTAKVGPISGDCTLVSGQLYWASSTTTEGGTPVTGTIDTVISTVTLNQDNDWSYLWTNLEKDGGITYTIKELTPDGYTATYQINGSDLAADTAFSLGESGDKVTVTNTANKRYVLPESGGVGYLPMAAGGAWSYWPCA